MDDELTRALATLDLAPGATWSEVLARYRQAAKAWHPDRFRSGSRKSCSRGETEKNNRRQGHIAKSLFIQPATASTSLPTSSPTSLPTSSSTATPTSSSAAIPTSSSVTTHRRQKATPRSTLGLAQ